MRLITPEQVKQYAPRPFVPLANCQHAREYATRAGMFCRDCHRTREAVTDFERGQVARLNPRKSSYVNYQMK